MVSYRFWHLGEPLRTVVGPDGRTLAFAVWGDADGFPVLALHGTPGCRLERWPDEDLYRRLGVCLVTHDRAGYGRSDRRHGRRVADETDDVGVLADHLGFERFAVTGASGGGPHALACAALLPDRVVRVACLVGGAPLGSPGLEREEWLAGQDPENVKEFGWAMAGEDVLYPELERELAEVAARVAVDPSTVLGNFELSEADRGELARPERIQIIRESVTEVAATGVAGGSTTISRSSNRGASRSTRSACRCSFAMAPPTCSSRRPMASGWPRTCPAASSRSTTQPATWQPTPSRR